MKTLIGFLLIGSILGFLIFLTIGINCSNDGYRGLDQVKCILQMNP